MCPSRTQQGDLCAMRTPTESPVTSEATVELAAVQSVGKAMAVIELLMRSKESLPARVIADQIGINRTTTHRLLRALMQLGWVEKPPSAPAYRLSIRFLALAQVATQGRNFMAEIRPGLEHLSKLTRETVHVGIRDGNEIVHIDRIDSLERVGVASKIGSRAALHTTGLGKAILAAETSSYLEEYIEHTRGTSGTVAFDSEAFRQEIETTRARGYSIDDEDDSVGVRCLGVAVLGAGGSPLFAISITGPSPRFTRAHVKSFAPEAMGVARTLSGELGWDGVRPDD